MQFLLTGFTQEKGLRTFRFDGVSADHKRTPFTVSADLALIMQYGIRLQELPLLCRDLLQDQEHDSNKSAFVFTQQDMRDHAKACAAAREASEQKRKMFRKPAPSPVNGES